mmetsp:Transcript_67338/g.186619  ORF Transcript_67338/g.186619 Transcript_67338/m.186619 type:complete len:469 (+) Transcript_67338:113-1519(+)
MAAPQKPQRQSPFSSSSLISGLSAIAVKATALHVNAGVTIYCARLQDLPARHHEAVMHVRLPGRRGFPAVHHPREAEGAVAHGHRTTLALVPSVWKALDAMSRSGLVPVRLIRPLEPSDVSKLRRASHPRHIEEGRIVLAESRWHVAAREADLVVPGVLAQGHEGVARRAHGPLDARVPGQRRASAAVVDAAILAAPGREAAREHAVAASDTRVEDASTAGADLQVELVACNIGARVDGLADDGLVDALDPHPVAGAQALLRVLLLRDPEGPHPEIHVVAGLRPKGRLRPPHRGAAESPVHARVCRVSSLRLGRAQVASHRASTADHPRSSASIETTSTALLAERPLLLVVLGACGIGVAWRYLIQLRQADHRRGCPTQPGAHSSGAPRGNSSSTDAQANEPNQQRQLLALQARPPLGTACLPPPRPLKQHLLVLSLGIFARRGRWWRGARKCTHCAWGGGSGRGGGR